MFAAVQMARMTGDRAAICPIPLRAQVLQKMRAAVRPRWLATGGAGGAHGGRRPPQRSLGDSLPPGLVLAAAPAA